MSKEIKFSGSSLAKIFKYLDQLRLSGITNMYGASPYIITAFGVPREKATRALVLWMETFAIDKSINDRVSDALKKKVEA